MHLKDFYRKLMEIVYPGLYFAQCVCLTHYLNQLIQKLNYKLQFPLIKTQFDEFISKFKFKLHRLTSQSFYLPTGVPMYNIGTKVM